MASCSIPFGWLVSVLMRWMAFKHAWLRKWPCITFASGSTCSLGATRWLSLICLTGEFIMSIHTKRLRNEQLGDREGRPYIFISTLSNCGYMLSIYLLLTS